MARARAIETRLEKLVPALDEYYSSGFLTREETVEVSRERTHWEYRLVAKPLLYLDVRGAVSYELALEQRLKEYCIHTKLNLQHRWDIIERIEGVYRIGLKHLKNKKEQEAVRTEFVLFLKQFQRNGSLSNLYGELMTTFPRRSDIWIEAAEWQASTVHNTDNARAIIQQSLLTMATEPAVWACALRIELQFVQRLLDGLVAEHRADARKARKAATAQEGEETEEGDRAETLRTDVIAPKLREENAGMGQVLLDLVLAKTVVEEALHSPASGGALVQQLLATAGDFAFAREVMELIVSTALTEMTTACASAAPAQATSSTAIASQQQQLRVWTQWRHPHTVDAVLAAHLGLEDDLTNAHDTAIVSAETYLAEGGAETVRDAARRRHGPSSKGYAVPHSFANPSTQSRRYAAALALVSALAFAALPVSAVQLGAQWLREESSSSQRLPSVRSAVLKALSHLVNYSSGDRETDSVAVSRVCAGLLRGPLQTSSSSPSAASPAGGKRKGKKVTAPATADHLDTDTILYWLLPSPMVEAAVRQGCSAEALQRIGVLRTALRASNGGAATETEVSTPPRARSRVEEESGAASTSAQTLLSWSVLQLDQFLRPEDREELRSTAAATTTVSTPTAAVLTAEELERFIRWWKGEDEEDDSVDASGRKESADLMPSAAQMRRCVAVMELLQRHGLLPTEAISACSAAQAWASTTAALLNPATALQNTTSSSSSGVLPLSTWRLFSALEAMLGPVVEGQEPTELLAQAAPRKSSKTSSSSDDTCSESGDDEDEQKVGMKRPWIRPSSTATNGNAALKSFAAAGLHFLAGIASSTLDRDAEWVRLEGVSSLLRCRLVSWLGRGPCTRASVLMALRGAANPAVAEAWIADVQALLRSAARCQPLPRHAYCQCIVPFLEGVALYRRESSSTSSAKSNAITATQAALQAARDAHETLLQLYGVSKHPESYLPLIFDGTSARALAMATTTATSGAGKASTAAVEQANTGDWRAYVVFERAVSNDLLKAKTVVEHGRRAAISPQQFMVQLNAL